MSTDPYAPPPIEPQLPPTAPVTVAAPGYQPFPAPARLSEAPTMPDTPPVRPMQLGGFEPPTAQMPVPSYPSPPTTSYPPSPYGAMPASAPPSFGPPVAQPPA